MKNKHLTSSDRIEIELGLKQNKSLTDIANVVDKSVGAIRNEIKNHREKKYPSSFNGAVNICSYFKDKTCNVTHLCKSDTCNKICLFCKIYFCNNICPQFEEYICESLTKKPYTCNGCNNYKQCRNIKMIYSASNANKEYLNTLSLSRKGEHISLDEIDYINESVTPRIKNGQSLEHINMTDDNINISTASLYNYTNNGLFTFKNIDLPKKLKYKRRKAKDSDNNIEPEKQTKIDLLKETRNYKLFTQYTKEHPKDNVSEMDTVIGTIYSSKVLLTLLFRKSNFMIALLVDDKKAKTISNKLNELKRKIGTDKFLLLFKILLTDNGVEFNLIEEIELIENDKKIHLFFCDSGKSNQKGKIEKNHVEIRKIIPKGTNFDHLTQKDINLMMSHINSYKRRKLGGYSPYDILIKEYGEQFTNELLNSLGYKIIEPKDIILKPKLLKKK